MQRRGDRVTILAYELLFLKVKRKIHSFLKINNGMSSYAHIEPPTNLEYNTL